MRQNRMDEINMHHDKLEVLEHLGLFEDADTYFYDNRWAFDWTRDGQYVGAVPNENGWTP